MHDNATLAGFLTAIWEQLATQSISQPSPDAQEDCCSKAFLCIMRSFISGLKSGVQVVSLSPNQLDAPQDLAGGAAPSVADVPAVNSAATSANISLPVTCSMIFPDPGQQEAAGKAGFLPPASQYSTIQVLCDAPAAGAGGQAPSLDVMARQIAVGYRSAGSLFGGHSGGSANGLGLVRSAQRVLHAHQVLIGVRMAGSLVSTPPWGEILSVSSYPAPYQGMPGFVAASTSQWNHDSQAGDSAARRTALNNCPIS